MYQNSFSGNLQGLLVPGPGVAQEGSYRSFDGFYGSLEECFTHETSEGWCFGGALFLMCLSPNPPYPFVIFFGVCDRCLAYEVG
jgi:hypothetical protein